MGVNRPPRPRPLPRDAYRILISLFAEELISSKKEVPNLLLKKIRFKADIPSDRYVKILQIENLFSPKEYHKVDFLVTYKLVSSKEAGRESVEVLLDVLYKTTNYGYVFPRNIMVGQTGTCSYVDIMDEKQTQDKIQRLVEKIVVKLITILIYGYWIFSYMFRPKWREIMEAKLKEKENGSDNDRSETKSS